LNFSPKNKIPQRNETRILKPARNGEVLESPINLTEYNARILLAVHIAPLRRPLGKISNPQKNAIGIAKRRTPIPVDPCNCQMLATLTFLTGTKKVPQQIAEPIAEVNPDAFKGGLTVRIAV